MHCQCAIRGSGLRSNLRVERRVSEVTLVLHEGILLQGAPISRPLLWHKDHILHTVRPSPIPRFFRLICTPSMLPDAIAAFRSKKYL